MTESFEKNLRIDALIFDIDGVLIDVSKSYRQAIIQTVDLFFNYALGLSYESDPQP
jgi:phosphoglycolate phosphatase-like HAD superfamily hydrolase